MKEEEESDAEPEIHEPNSSPERNDVVAAMLNESAPISARARPGECTMCLVGVKSSARVRITKCAHQFHASCLETWAYYAADRYIAAVAKGARGERPSCPSCLQDLEIAPRVVIVPPRPPPFLPPPLHNVLPLTSSLPPSPPVSHSSHSRLSPMPHAHSSRSARSSLRRSPGRHFLARSTNGQRAFSERVVLEDAAARAILEAQLAAERAHALSYYAASSARERGMERRIQW